MSGMIRTVTRYRSLGIVALAVVLGGCLEVNADARFNDKGEALVDVEIGVSLELVALLAAGGQQPPVMMDLFKNCALPLPNVGLARGVRSVKNRQGQRAGLLTCVVSVDVSDPIAASAGIKGSDTDLSIERLPDADGYRIRGVLKPPPTPPPPPNSAALIAGMFANRFITIAIAGHRTENCNGELTADGKKAVWKIPLIALFGPSVSTPFTIEADVIYRESWLRRWRRRLFGGGVTMSAFTST